MRGGGSIPEVRIERTPVKMFGLGILGFDHLQIVFVPSHSAMTEQDRWFVIEGVRDVETADRRHVLGVVGWDGATTLADANGGRSGQALANHIGTPDERGGRLLAGGSEALETWSLIAGAAGDIARQNFPYIAYAPDASPLPTLNSSSLISSLLFHAGLDYTASLPMGLRFSPGLSTLLAGASDDRLRLPDTYSALLAGGGDDVIVGRSSVETVDKLYGGRGEDTLGWSRGREVLHGGEPGLPYAADGEDRVSYAGVGPISIVGHGDAREHLTPDFTATFEGGSDDLFSIEELVWDDRSDHITVGPGAGLIRSSLSISTEGGDDWIDAGRAAASLVIASGDGDDALVLGGASFQVESGTGADRLVIAGPRADVELLDATPADRIIVPWQARSAFLSLDERAPSTAVLTIFGDDGQGAAIVRLRDFVPGVLGLCTEPPAQVPLHMFRGGGDAGACDGGYVAAGEASARPVSWTDAPQPTSEEVHEAPEDADVMGHF